VPGQSLSPTPRRDTHALVSRLTILGAPESLQGAVAAGLLGLGNTFVGTMEGAARICAEYLPADPVDRGGLDAGAISALAAQVVADYRERGEPLPGIGHPVHKPVDPRAQKLLQISDQLNFDDAAPRLMTAVSVTASEARGKLLPLNVTGAIGALSNTLGLPFSAARGLGVMARAIGLVGHLLEERDSPLAASVWTRAERESTQ
jgi:citrate synthase